MQKSDGGVGVIVSDGNGTADRERRMEERRRLRARSLGYELDQMEVAGQWRWPRQW